MFTTIIIKDIRFSFLSELLIKRTVASGLCAKCGPNLHEITLRASEGACQG